jgi:hypothetical protein
VGRYVTCVTLDLATTATGRLEGRLTTVDGTCDIGFSGVLELLRLLEHLTRHEADRRPEEEPAPSDDP